MAYAYVPTALETSLIKTERDFMLILDQYEKRVARNLGILRNEPEIAYTVAKGKLQVKYHRPLR